MKQEDIMLFVEAMVKYINNHKEENNFTIVQILLVPATVKTIKSIWSFKRKQKPEGKLLNHKAKICAHEGIQQWGGEVAYWKTYYPVVNMLSVRLLLCITKIQHLDSKTINFVLAFPQAKLNKDIWMQLLAGFQVYGETEENPEKHYLLKLEVLIYGLNRHFFFIVLFGTCELTHRL